VGSGREVHGKENPRKRYVEGLRTEPTSLVRGSSRRITIMRLRPANIRVINRRENHLDHDLRCLLKGKRKRRKQLLVVDRSLHISALSEARFQEELRTGTMVWRAFDKDGFTRSDIPKVRF
jgi:hypothetical protein